MIQFRLARISDVSQLQIVRNSVKENALSDPSVVKDEDYLPFLTDSGKGWLAEADGQVVGFAIVDLKDRNVWALFVHPDFEGKGIGKQLHDVMMSWYFSQTSETIWLGTAPNTRAEGFYASQGWERAGMHGKEVKFEMSRSIAMNQMLGKQS